MKNVSFILLAGLFACLTTLETNAQQSAPDAVPAKHAEGTVTFKTPFPPYPYQARAIGAQGSDSIEVTFDEQGKATKAVMVKTTGYKVLDQNTEAFARANWKSSGGKRITIIRPVVYKVTGF